MPFWRNIPPDTLSKGSDILSKGQQGINVREWIYHHELRAKEKSIRAIASKTDRSRATVRKYLRAEGILERQPRPKRGSKLDKKWEGVWCLPP